MSERAALYRLFDAEGALLYVGVTRNPDIRFGQHASTKPWWPEVARRDVAWFERRREALAAEIEAIWTENPRYNVGDRPVSRVGKGRKLSLMLPDDVHAAWKATGLPLSAVIRRGLDVVEARTVAVAVQSSPPAVLREELAANNAEVRKIVREELERIASR